MKKSVFISLCLLTFSNYVEGQCVTNEGNVYSFIYNGKNYEIIKENLNWVNAAACAVERGGYLSEINDQDEEDTIFYHVNNAGIIASNTVAPDGGSASYLWIGGNDLNVEGDWMWDGDNTGPSVQFWQGTSSGVPIGGLYNNWGNEPDDFSGQDALGFAYTDWPLGFAGEWNDVDDSNTLYYIVEYPNTTGTNDMNSIENGLKIYPNPSNDLVIIAFHQEIEAQTKFSIYSLSGELIKEFVLEQSSSSIELSGLEDGVYFIQINNDESGKARAKFIVQR